MSSYSPFIIEKKELELSFTYYYFVGYSASISSGISSNDEVHFTSEDDSFIDVKWKKSETANNFREKYLENIIVDKFNLNPSIIFREIGAEITGTTNATDYKFSFEKLPADKEELDYSEGIECYLLKNGYFVLRVNLLNTQNIPAFNVLQLIRHPELLSLDSCDGRTGDLAYKLEKYIDIIQEKIVELARENYTNLVKIRVKAFSKNSDKTLRVKDKILKREDEKTIHRSRPYIGTSFSLKKLNKSELETVLPSVKSFVVAAARTTPAFLTQFDCPGEYLNRSNRNVYAPGKSIIYMARRGWSVFNHGDHYPLSFKLGTIECAYMVIISINSTSRLWSLFMRDINEHGSPIFEELNKTVKIMVARSWWQIWMPFYEVFNFHSKISKATSFLASARIIVPEENYSKLLEAHIMSHTARAAITRCEKLTSYLTLEQSGVKKLSLFSNYLNVASTYFRSKTAQYARIGIIISLISLIMFLVKYLSI